MNRKGFRFIEMIVTINIMYRDKSGFKWLFIVDIFQKVHLNIIMCLVQFQQVWE